MSQHNIKRRIRALERLHRELGELTIAHLGVVKFLLTEKELNALTEDIDAWSLTDANGTLAPPPTTKAELLHGLISGHYLLMNGIARVQLNSKEL
jgi:hypothetical protein